MKLQRRYLQFPTPYWGGKSRVANLVWAALGDVRHYMEPFFGSGAVLLARPNYNPDKHIETVCDKDGLLCNVWRALQFAPDEVAKWCDWPINHADLIARRKVLLRNEPSLLDKLINDEKYFDPVMAGYWIWVASTSIVNVSFRTNTRPQLTQYHGIHKLSLRHHIYDWFRSLSERLRYVRVVCGDWTKICGGNWQNNLGLVGIFFDPPYGVDDRSVVYRHDDIYVSLQVRQWCIERGKHPDYRICLAGYFEEHQELINHGWSVVRWKAHGGMAHTASKNKTNSRGKRNRFREALFFSPHCIRTRLFDNDFAEMSLCDTD